MGISVGSREVRVPGREGEEEKRRRGCDKRQRNNSNNNNNNNSYNTNIKGDKAELRYGSRYSDWARNWMVRASNVGREKSVFRLVRKISKIDS